MRFWDIVDEQDGLTALFMACEVGDVPTVEVLLGFGADLNIREKVSFNSFDAVVFCWTVLCGVY